MNMEESPFTWDMYFDDVYNSNKVRQSFEEGFGVEFIKNSDQDWMRYLTLHQLAEQMENRGILTKTEFEMKLEKANNFFAKMKESNFT